MDEALDLLAAEDPLAADLVKLKYFVGMTMGEVAEALGISLRSDYGSIPGPGCDAKSERVNAGPRTRVNLTLGVTPPGG